MNKNPKTKSKIHKSDIMTWWRTLLEHKHTDPHNTILHPIENMEILPHTFQGSRFGHDALRIEGSKEFIGSILAGLDEVYEMEDEDVRLEIVMYELDLSEVQKPHNKKQSHWVLYIRTIYRDPSYKSLNQS